MRRKRLSFLYEYAVGQMGRIYIYGAITRVKRKAAYRVDVHKIALPRELSVLRRDHLVLGKILLLVYDTAQQ